MATGQLSGAIPTVRVVADGWKCEPILGGTPVFSRNPVYILRELLLNPVDGLGDWFSSADIDAATWATVKTACDVMWKNAYVSFQLDLVLDVTQRAQDWIQHIMGTFRGIMLESNGVLKLYQDVARVPTRTFDARLSRDPASRPILALDDGRPDIAEHEIPSSDRATHTSVTYYDEKEDYARANTDEWKQFVSVDWSDGDPVVQADFDYPGVTGNVQALRQGQYLMERARLRTRIVEFGVGPGDFDLLPLDVVNLKADSPAIDASYQVLTLQFDPHGLRGRVTALLYDADAYDDDYRVTPDKSAYLSRAAALTITSAKTVPQGITDLKITAVY
jgi:predicted phage tail protein